MAYPNGGHVNQPKYLPHDPAQMISPWSDPNVGHETVGHEYNIPTPEHQLQEIRLVINQLLCFDNYWCASFPNIYAPDCSAFKASRLVTTLPICALALVDSFLVAA